MVGSRYGQELGAHDDGEQAAERPGGASSVVTHLAPAAPAGGPTGANRVSMPEDFERRLEDAEGLIQYAAYSGIDVGDDLRRDVIAARLTASGGWTEEHSLKILAAVTRLSARLRPVSAESLRKCVGRAAARTLRAYRWVACALAIIIMPYSYAASVATATCEAIRKDIETANTLAVTLSRQLLPAPATVSSDKQAPAGDLRQHGEEEIRDLQQLAATVRAIDARAMHLRLFVWNLAGDPFRSERGAQFDKRFELNVESFDISTETKNKIVLYQGVRHFAQSVQEAVSTTFGAATSCILPTLYALLGACAFLLRLLERQLKAHTFTGMDGATARFFIAGISGLVIGLFGNYSGTHGLTLPPLAVAFLVGYGADIFFSFLDGVSRSRADAGTENRGAAGTAGSK